MYTHKDRLFVQERREELETANKDKESKWKCYNNNMLQAIKINIQSDNIVFWVV